jgi:hypothetical protein
MDGQTGKLKLVFVALGFCLIFTGCHSIGPETIARDRFDYSGSLSDSWKRQTMLNIVKLRYLDPPIFVDVGQIVSGYTLQTGVNAGASLPQNGNFGGDTATFGGAALFTDRPTITYVPLTGNKFIKGLMTPLPPESVFFTIQAGYPADAVLFSAVASMNGLKNQEASLDGVSPPDPNFLRMLTLMRRIQLSGAVGMRVQMNDQKQDTTILTFRSANISQETLNDIHGVRQLLHLDQNINEFKLTFGASPRDDTEVAVQTRSILNLMSILATQVEVPADDLIQTRAVPGWESAKGTNGLGRIIQIHSSESKPADAFVAINYRNHWFWIDDRDLKSKRVFSFMMMLFTLADTTDKEAPPVLTIPTQ